jgi:DNA-binding MarR family transcriptional regulator
MFIRQILATQCPLQAEFYIGSLCTIRGVADQRDYSSREHIVAALHAAARLRVRHLARGQSLTSNTALARLADDGPLRLTVLAEAGGVTQPAMTQLVGRLERAGFVIRYTDPLDRRAILVEITSQGRSFLAEVRQSINNSLIDLLETLSPEDEATLALAMRVARPLIENLVERAAGQPLSGRNPAPLLT